MTKRHGLVKGLVSVSLVSALAAGWLVVGADSEAGAEPSSAYSLSKVVGRLHLPSQSREDEDTADQRQISVSVNTTKRLRDSQPITVTWSGAHPTGGVVNDPNSAEAAGQEYPVVIMQCRGLDSAASPLNPKTCWTQTPGERYVGRNDEMPAFRMDRYASEADRAISSGRPNPLPEKCDGFVSATVDHWTHFIAEDGTDFAGGPYGCAGLPPEAVTDQNSLSPGTTTYAVTDAEGKGSVKFFVQSSNSNASLGCSVTVACSLVVLPIMGISCDYASVIKFPVLERRTRYEKCTAAGRYKPGQQTFGDPLSSVLSVTGSLWWSESNWRNRFSIPLTFDATSDVCEVVGSGSTTLLYGSQAVRGLMEQWVPAFCTNKNLFRMRMVQTPEPQAKNLLRAGVIGAALQLAPPDEAFETPTVQAPIGVTAWGVAFVVDDVTGHPLDNLNLNPRLLAKLLTMSYQTGPTFGGEYRFDYQPEALRGLVKGSGAARVLHYRVTANLPEGESAPSPDLTVSGAPQSLTADNYVEVKWDTVPRATSYNIYRGDSASGEKKVASNVPVALFEDKSNAAGVGNVPTKEPRAPWTMEKSHLDLGHDPEFQALNPTKLSESYSSIAASALYTVSSDSDVMFSLTSYINADPEARAWLNGKADPWGMTVNPNYLKIPLPTQSWPILDTFVPQRLVDTVGCWRDSPTPWLPLVQAPVSDPSIVALNMTFTVANSQTECKNPNQPNQKLGAVGRQVVGRRFQLGVVSYADAQRGQLKLASLQTQSGAPKDVQFDTAAGRSFVPPTEQSIAAAVGMLRPDVKLGTWPIPYAAMRSQAAGKAAYPGVLLASADIPVKGLTRDEATRLSKFLTFAATLGQTPGFGNGQAPPGYVSLTSMATKKIRAAGVERSAVVSGTSGVAASLLSYTKVAAAAVTAQSGVAPRVDGSVTPTTPATPRPSPSTSSSSEPSAPVTNDSSSDGATSLPIPEIPDSSAPSAEATSSPSPTMAPTASPSPSSSQSSSASPAIVSAGKTAPVKSSPGTWILPALLVFSCVTGLAALVLGLARKS